jgi:hypothetical protein
VVEAGHSTGGIGLILGGFSAGVVSSTSIEAESSLPQHVDLTRR